MQDPPTANETDALIGGSRAPQGSAKSRLLLVAMLSVAAGFVGYSSGYHAHYSGHLDLEKVEDFHSENFPLMPTEGLLLDPDEEGQYGAEQVVDLAPPLEHDPERGLEQYDDMMKHKDEIHTEFMLNVKEALDQQNGQFDHGDEEVDGTAEFADVLRNGHFSVGRGNVDVDVTDAHDTDSAFGSSSGAGGTSSGGGTNAEIDIVVEDANNEHPSPDVPAPELTDSMERDIIKQGRENEIVIQSEADLKRYQENYERVMHQPAPLEGNLSPEQQAEDAANAKVTVDDRETEVPIGNGSPVAAGN